MSRSSYRPGLVLRRVGILAGLGLAATGISVAWGLSVEPLVVVEDVSESRGEPGRAVADESPDATVLVADGTLVVPRGGSANAGALGRDRSRLADGLAAARRALRGDGATGGAVRLVTDGRDTEGGVLEAARALAADGVRVHVAPGDPPAADIGIEAVRAATAAADGPAVLRATLSGSVSGRGRVVLRREGRERASRDVVLAPDVPLDVELADPTPRADPAGFEVEWIPGPGTPDDVRGNNRVRLEVPAEGRRVAIVGEGAASAVTERWVRTVRHATLADVDLDDADLLVLSDVPERVVRDELERVVRFVAGGGALLVLGGPDAYGPGGVGGTPYGAFLPLRPRADDAERTLCVVALDRSGSTAESDPSRPAAIVDLLAAIRALVARLPPRTSLVVFPFADTPEAPIPATGPVASGDAAGEAALRAGLGAIVPGGGTDLVAALEAGIRLTRSAPRDVRRRLLLLTDGDPDHPPAPGAFLPLRASLEAEGVELGAIVRGDDACVAALRAIAARPDAVIRIEASSAFPESLLRAFDRGRAPDELVAAPFEPRPADGTPDAEAAARARPTRLHRLEPAPDATVLARAAGPDGVPLAVAAARRVGAGVVVGYAGGAALEPAAARAAFDAALDPLRRVVAARADRGLAATREGDRLVVEGPPGLGELLVASLDAPTASLVETRSGLYEGRLGAGLAPDAVLFATNPSRRALRLPAAPPLERRRVGVDRRALEAIAAAGGGRVLAPSEPTPRRKTSSRTDLSPYVLGMALLLFVLDRALATRARRSP